MLAATVHMEITALWAAPLQGQTLNSWFAVVVGSKIVEPCSLSMNGIDTLAHSGQPYMPMLERYSGSQGTAHAARA